MSTAASLNSLPILTRTDSASTAGSAFTDTDEGSGHLTPSTPFTPTDETATASPTQSHFFDRFRRISRPTSQPTSSPTASLSEEENPFDADYISVIETELLAKLGERGLRKIRMKVLSDIHSEMEDPWTKKPRGRFGDEHALNKADEQTLKSHILTEAEEQILEESFVTKDERFLDGYKEGLRILIHAHESTLEGHVNSYKTGGKPWSY